jgi:hypothetical protein
MQCELNGIVYDFGCEHCRTRFLKTIPCKVMRKNYAEWIESKGEVGDWKTEPNCGCTKQCQMEVTRNEILQKLSQREKARERKISRFQRR